MEEPKKMPKHFPMSERAPVEPDNPAIVRYSSACFHCGNCKWSCLDQTGLLERYTLENTGDRAICLYCGQCVNECPGAAMSERLHYPAVKAAMAEGRIAVASISPAVRTSLAEAFGLEVSFSLGQTVDLLKKLGFTYVLDTTFGADLTVMEEATELVSRLKKGGPLPLFTSCCPSWVRYAELFYPQWLPNLSGTKSPVCMQGTMIKTAFAKERQLNPEKLLTVAVTPCTAKKAEILRPEMNAAGAELGLDGIQDTDYAITVRELVRWAREAGIRFADLRDTQPDAFSGSGAGNLFGSTGGVMEAALRTAYFLLNGVNPPDGFLQLEAVRGNEAVREAEVDMGVSSIRVAVLFGTREAGAWLEAQKERKESFHYVEVMTCPGGCIGGGGQPKHFIVPGLQVPERRKALLYARDKAMPLRLSHENPELKALYQTHLGEPGGEKACRLLHVPFRSDASEELQAGK